MVASVKTLTQDAPNIASDMVYLPAGTFWAGSDRHYREEAPRHLRSVDAFHLSASPVTNAEFADFVAQTGYVTDAQRLGVGAVFTPPSKDRRALSDGWAPDPQAFWHKPDGRTDLTAAHDDHPVVQITFSDASTYAQWAGARLPSEAEWEYAASSGQGESEYIWGKELTPNGKRAANIWARGFPYKREAGLAEWGTTPVGRFAPNPLGLYDMIGNTWEWTTDRYTTSYRAKSCCVKSDGVQEHVIKGGSHLCSPSYCQRYRSAARHAFSADMSTNHVGFRLAFSATGHS